MKGVSKMSFVTEQDRKQSMRACCALVLAYVQDFLVIRGYIFQALVEQANLCVTFRLVTHIVFDEPDKGLFLFDSVDVSVSLFDFSERFHKDIVLIGLSPVQIVGR